MIDWTKMRTAEQRLEDAYAHAKEAEIAAERQALRDTDWMVIRKMEKNIPIPASVDARRDAARKRIDDLEKGRVLPNLPPRAAR